MRRSRLLAFLLLPLLPVPAHAQGAAPLVPVPNRPANDNSTAPANTRYVDGAAQRLLDAIGQKAPLASPSFSGTVTAPAYQGDASGASVQAPYAGTVPRPLRDRAGEAHVSVDDYAGTDAARLQAAVNACPATGCALLVPARTLTLAAPVTLKSHVRIAGVGHAAGFGTGATFINGQPGSGTGPMFLLPQGTTGLSIEGVAIDGNNKSQACIRTTDGANGVFGSFDIHISKSTFRNCKGGAIDAIYAFDWWVTHNVFKNNGNMAGGAGRDRATIYIRNSALSGVGNNSNNWHIVDNFIENGKARGIWFDSTAGSDQNQSMFVRGNHFEGDYGVGGYEAVYATGGLLRSMITGNLFQGTSGGIPLINLGTGGYGNVVSANAMASAGTYGPSPSPANTVLDGNYADVIDANTISSAAGAPPGIVLTAQSGNVTAANNKSTGGVPAVQDLGADNSVYGNDATPAKTYTPAITFPDGRGVSAANAAGWSYRIGKTLHFQAIVQVLYTSAPSRVVVSVPNGARLAGFQVVAAWNPTSGSGLQATGADGASGLSVTSVTGGTPLAASGQYIVIRGAAQVQ